MPDGSHEGRAENNGLDPVATLKSMATRSGADTGTVHHAPAPLGQVTPVRGGTRRRTPTGPRRIAGS